MFNTINNSLIEDVISENPYDEIVQADNKQDIIILPDSNQDIVTLLGDNNDETILSPIYVNPIQEDSIIFCGILKQSVPDVFF